MSILLDENTKIVVQGITGKQGQLHTKLCTEYAQTNVVAGVTPNKEGETFEGIPIYNTVEKAVKETGANCSLIFVPPPFAADAILEAIDVNIPLIITITEGIPVSDMLKVNEALKKSNSKLLGPNCPGAITPEVCKAGIMPGDIHKKGNVGIVSRSGTLTYEAVHQVTQQGLGQSSCIGIGGAPISGLSFIDVLELFEKDPQTEAIVMIGEIGGLAENEAAAYIKENVTKPVVGFIAGQAAPAGKRMGHAGAIIAGKGSTAKEKIEFMRQNGINVVDTMSQIGTAVKEALNA